MLKNRSVQFFIVIIALLNSLSICAQRTSLKFRPDKKFKIVQFTDTHIKADTIESQVTIKTMSEVLDKEKPDFVVFTGDVVTDHPVEKGWKMVTKPVISRKIPFAVVFGNHDDEQGMTRAELSKIVETFPNCSFVTKVEDVYGYGNYVVKIASSEGENTAALLYCMDSNAYSTIDSVGGYGWFKFDQINWYRTQSKSLKEANNGKLLPALAFFHIPLPEYREAYLNQKNPAIGIRLEKECSPDINSGMYTAMLESGDVMGTFVGHDHNNDYIAYLHGIALAYGRFTGSKNTYTDLPNGARVIELTEGSRTFKTWIRTGTGEVYCPVDFPKSFLK